MTVPSPTPSNADASSMPIPRRGHDDRPARTRRRPARRAVRVLREEVAQLRPALLLASALGRLLPAHTGGRARAGLLRAAGVSVGRGTVLAGTVAVDGHADPRRNLTIGRHVYVNVGCRIDASAPVSIGDDVHLAHDVLILTNTHRLGSRTRRAAQLEARPVRIGAGSWIGARATILPGRCVGPGAVVAAGAVVVDDVPADTTVAGVPARAIRHREPPAASAGEHRPNVSSRVPTGP